MADGSWASSTATKIGTSFAILFLTRANFAVDLSANLRGKGFGGELRGGGLPQMKAIPFQEQEVPKAKPGQPPPKISGIREVTQADGPRRYARRSCRRGRTVANSRKS